MAAFFLDGLKISGYRSFNEEMTFDGLGKINLVIGQNNSGKSNLLRFLTKHLRGGNIDGLEINPIVDLPRKNPHQLEIALKINKNSDLLKASIGGHIQPFLDRSLFKSIDSIWIYYQYEGKQFKQNQQTLEKTLSKIEKIERQEWYNLWNQLTHMTGGGEKVWQSQSIERLGLLERLAVVVDLIPAIRTLKPIQYKSGFSTNTQGRIERDGIGDHSGLNLIEELFKIQSPAMGEEKYRERFDKINNFMREVLGNQSLQIEIPYDKSNVIINMDGKRLNIEEVGTGIEEILIIAAKSTMFTNQIVCIEEPELHLHPTLQRKLLQYLYEQTDNQYFIATHSAHILDCVPCSTYHIKLVDGYSQVVSSISAKDKYQACSDLGYKASDLFQSNFIVWVEGPSDRIYLNSWIKNVAPDLMEGLHYSIMFYGGRLLSHLSANEETINEFISLQRLNRNMAIVIDSDKKSKQGHINATKKRIREEFESNGYFVWITEGKEIENYISDEIFQKSLVSLYGENDNVFPRSSPFENMTVYHSNKKGERNVDKIRLAHAVAEYPSDLTVLDLKKKINLLVNKIRDANLLRV